MKIDRPNIDDPLVEKILDAINAEYDPIILRVVPSANSQPNECFENVQKKIDQFGGRMILGYQIWKSQYLIEAEVHAVWEDKKENLHDITAKTKNINSIMFVEDTRIKYEGKQINNVRLNITDNELVDYLINLYDIFFFITNKEERAKQHFLLLLSPEEQKDIEQITKYENELKIMIDLKQNMNSICFCGGSAIFSNCHGKSIKELKEKHIA